MTALRLVDGSLLADVTAAVLVPSIRGFYAWLVRAGIAHPVQ